MKLALKILVRLTVLAAIAAAFACVPFCWISVKVQGLVWGVVATLLLGRLFCDVICPLGILQSAVNWLFHPRTHVRRVCSRLPETKAQRIVRWSVFAACVALAAAGCMGAAETVLPISIVGKAASLWAPGLAMLGAVLALAAVGRGRVWCNWVCPFGTLYNLVARIALRKDKVGRGCGACRKCLEAGTPSSSAAGKPAGEGSEPAGGVTRREALKGVALVAVAEKLADGGLAAVSLPGRPARRVEVLPPGAGDRRTFALRCAGCQLCVVNCPGQCLRPSTSFAAFGQPVMDFRHGYCLASCVKCGEVCPENALGRLQREQRPNVHVGYAVWSRELCVRTTNGDACTACERKCPVRAIHLVGGFPVVDRDRCIGCGACEHVCPARPMPAIRVEGYEVQRQVNPIAEGDLVAEMRARLDAGASVVAARGGVMVAERGGRGLAPLLDLLDAGSLRDAVVMDKVVGRAAAAIYAQSGALRVYARLAGRGAAEIMSAKGIPLVADETVDLVLDRDRSGSCPMEAAVSGLEDTAQMVEVLRKAVAR